MSPMTIKCYFPDIQLIGIISILLCWCSICTWAPIRGQ